MIGKLWTVLTATACFCTCACRDQKEATQTVIAIDAVASVRDAIARVSAHVRSENDQGEYDQAADADKWPLLLVLAPKNDDANRRFEVELTAANADGKTLLVVRLSTGFVAGSSRYVSVLLHETCLGGGGGNDRCRLAECNHFAIAASELGTTQLDAHVFDVTCPADATKPPNKISVGEAGAGGVAGSAGKDKDEGGNGGSASAGAGGSTQVDPDAGQAGAAGGPDCVVEPCGPVDRCAQLPCGDHGTCENNGTGYTCNCDMGYHSTLATCVDNRNCGANNGGCAENCNKSMTGAFECACNSDGWLKADGSSCGHTGERTAISTTSSTVPCEPQVAFDAAGGGVAVWIQGEAGAAQLYTAQFSPASAKWSKPEPIAGAVAPGLTSPKLLVTAPDTGVVVWLQQGMFKEVWFAPYAAGKFGAPKAMPSPGTGNAVWPEIAAAANGDALLAWTNNLSNRSELWVNGYLGKSGIFTDALKIDGSETLTAFMGRLALDQIGRANIAWSNAMVTDGTTTAPFNSTPWFARYDPVTRTPAVTMLDENIALTPDVAVSPSGLGVTVWQRFAAQPPSINVVARRFEGTSAIGMDSTLSLTRSQFPSTGPRVGVGANGEAIAVWTQLVGTARTIWGATSAGPQASWIAATKLNTEASVVPAWGAAFAQEPALDLAVDPQGDGFSVWSDFRADATRTIWLRRARARARQAKAGFDEPIRLEMDTAKTRVSHARVAVTPEGKGAVVWDHLNADGRYEVWARELR